MCTIQRFHAPRPRAPPRGARRALGATLARRRGPRERTHTALRIDLAAVNDHTIIGFNSMGGIPNATTVSRA